MLNIKKRPTKHDGTKVERRDSDRFPVSVPLEVSWRGPEGKAQKAQGMASHVNANGGLIEMSDYPDVGSRVSLTNFLSAATAEARVLATPTSREGVAKGIVVELIAANESFWGVNLQVRKTSVELQKLEESLQTEGINPRLLNEFREAIDYLRSTSLAVEKLREFQLQGKDEDEIDSFLVADRIRRATNLCLEIVTDLEADKVTSDVKGVEKFYRTLEQVYDHLRVLVKRRDPDRYGSTRQ